MTKQFTQGQTRLKRVNLIAAGLFLLFIVAGQLYFIAFFTSEGTVLPSLDALIDVLTFIAPASLALTLYIRKVIKAIYVRETAHLAEGFYTQRSWLDVEDLMMVYTIDNQVSFFEIPKYNLDDLQAAYQAGEPFSKLHEEAGVSAAKVTHIDMKNILGMTSSHKKDIIEIEVEDEIHNIDFLNIETKNHALKRFALMLNDQMQYQHKTPNRIQASRAWLITLAIFIAVMAIFHNPYIWAILFSIGFFLILPKALRELIEPSQFKVWKMPD